MSYRVKILIFKFRYFLIIRVISLLSYIVKFCTNSWPPWYYENILEDFDVRFFNPLNPLIVYMLCTDFSIIKSGHENNCKFCLWWRWNNRCWSSCLFLMFVLLFYQIRLYNHQLFSLHISPYQSILFKIFKLFTLSYYYIWQCYCFSIFLATGLRSVVSMFFLINIKYGRNL